MHWIVLFPITWDGIFTGVVSEKYEIVTRHTSEFFSAVVFYSACQQSVWIH